MDLPIDEIRAVLAQRAGAAEVQAPMDFAWKPRTSCVRDPSGNLIDLNQS